MLVTRLDHQLKSLCLTLTTSRLWWLLDLKDLRLTFLRYFVKRLFLLIPCINLYYVLRNLMNTVVNNFSLLTWYVQPGYCRGRTAKR